MKLITRDTDYALRAVCFMAKNKDKVVCADEMVKKLKIPKAFLRKLLQILGKNRMLKSHKGQGGGFLLSKPAQRIYLLDLIRIFQGPLKLNECFFKKLACPNKKTCALKKRIDKIEEYVIKELGAISIGSLLK